MLRLSLSFKRKTKSPRESTETNEKDLPNSRSNSLSEDDNDKKNQTTPKKSFKRTSLRRISLRKVRRTKSAPKPLEEKKIEKKDISFPRKVESLRS